MSPRPRRGFRESDRYLVATGCVWYDGSMLRAIAFFALVTSAFASATLDVLVNAAASFSATIQQQLEMLQGGPPGVFSGKSTNGQVGLMIFCRPSYSVAKALSE